MEKLKKEYEINKEETKVVEEICSALNLSFVTSLNSKETEYKVAGTNYSIKETNDAWILFDSGNLVRSFEFDRDVYDYLEKLKVKDVHFIPLRSEVMNQAKYSVGETAVEFIKQVVNENGALQTCVKVTVTSESKEEMERLDHIIQGIIYEEKIQSFFVGSLSLFDRLKELDKKKQILRRVVNESAGLDRPMVITVSGTPRAGKTTCIDNLYEFLKKADLRTVRLEEPAGLVYQTLKNKEEKKELLKDRVGFVDRQYEIGSSAIGAHLKDADVILCDRGALDTFIWYDMYYQDGMMSDERYQAFLKRLQDSSEYYNYFCSLYVDPFTSMQRDYINSLSIEPRTTMNIGNVEKYNAALARMEGLFKPNLDGFSHIDTTDLERMDASILVVEDVMDRVQKLCRGK